MTGLEPAASGVTGRRSARLSYIPAYLQHPARGWSHAGSSGRTRTFNPSVNSRLRCHCATLECGRGSRSRTPVLGFGDRCSAVELIPCGCSTRGRTKVARLSIGCSTVELWSSMSTEGFSGAPAGTRTPVARIKGPPLFHLSYRRASLPWMRGAPGRIRTSTSTVKSRLLCQLSYGGGIRFSRCISDGIKEEDPGLSPRAFAASRPLCGRWGF